MPIIHCCYFSKDLMTSSNKVGKFFVVLFLSMLLSSCLDTMTEQDFAFIAKVKERLKHKGDIVRVSDIHPGDWKKVCFTLAGARNDVLRVVSGSENVNESQIKVSNRKRSDAGHGDMFEWGIYFFYPPNVIEYFRIYNGDTYPDQLHAMADKYGCVAKEFAHFKAMSDQRPNKYRPDSLTIQLTEIKKGK